MRIPEQARMSLHAMHIATDEALETSKRSGKNAATLFGVTADWQLFRRLCEDGLWLEELCLSGATTQGFVRRLMRYARDCRAFLKGQIYKGLYLSHMAYDIKRNCSSRMKASDLERLRLWGQNKESFSKAELSISWALYRTRVSS